jgi:hypothetical protein
MFVCVAESLFQIPLHTGDLEKYEQVLKKRKGVLEGRHWVAKAK